MRTLFARKTRVFLSWFRVGTERVMMKLKELAYALGISGSMVSRLSKKGRLN
jgi:hypothetical protein